MKKTRNIKYSKAYIIVLVFVASSCCKIEAPSIQVEILSEEGYNLLFTPPPSDSNWVWHESNTGMPSSITVINTGLGPKMHIWSDGFVSGKDYYLQVDPSDVDTINIEYKVKGFNCNVKTKVEKITYNGNEFSGGKKGESVSVVKY